MCGGLIEFNSLGNKIIPAIYVYRQSTLVYTKARLTAENNKNEPNILSKYMQEIYAKYLTIIDINALFNDFFHTTAIFSVALQTSYLVYSPYSLVGASFLPGL